MNLIKAYYLLAIVADHYGITSKDLESGDHRQSIAKPRRTAMYLCGELCGMDARKIGSLFNQSISSVWIAQRSIRKEILTNEELRRQVQEIESRVERLWGKLA